MHSTGCCRGDTTATPVRDSHADIGALTCTFTFTRAVLLFHLCVRACVRVCVCEPHDLHINTRARANASTCSHMAGNPNTTPPMIGAVGLTVVVVVVVVVWPTPAAAGPVL